MGVRSESRVKSAVGPADNPRVRLGGGGNGRTTNERHVNGSCENHPFEMGVDLCAHCGRDFCQECLVYPRGPKKPPFCVRCAIAAAGVRSTAARTPAVSRRELKRLRKERAKRADVEATQPPATVSSAMDWETVSTFGVDKDRPVAVPVEDEEIPDYEPAAAWNNEFGDDRFSDSEEEFRVLRPAFDENLSRTT
jgi:hypothetical protein